MKVWISRDKGFNFNKVRISQKEPGIRSTILGSVGEKILYLATSENSVRIDAHIFEGIFNFVPKKGTCVEKELILK